jgi:hypothetical protein
MSFLRHHQKKNLSIAKVSLMIPMFFASGYEFDEKESLLVKLNEIFSNKTDAPQIIYEKLITIQCDHFINDNVILFLFDSEYNPIIIVVDDNKNILMEIQI